MKTAFSRRVVRLYTLLLGLALSPLRADEPAPAEAPPKGEVTQYKFSDSKIYPGTVRDYWVYVPKQYDPAKPACLYVNQDGIQYKAPAVFDQLIDKHDMPVTIGVFVMWGRVSALAPTAGDRFNRSVEFDTADGLYARFLIEELLPAIEKQSAASERPIHFSRDPNDRCIAGASSGAACAFAAAWERPDSFGRVFSTIGTYVGLRGADCFPTLIRKTEPKPLRIFLQEGSNDQNIFAGDWWMANQMMERALTFAGYEVNHVWGQGGHSTDEGTAIFADAMRWVWKDWPAPIKAGAGSPELQTILFPDEPWKLVIDGLQSAGAPAADPKGNVVFADAATGKSYRIGQDGSVKPADQQKPGITGRAFRGDGRLFSVGAAGGGILATGGGGPEQVVEPDVKGRDLVVCHDGSMYVTQPATDAAAASQIWYVSPEGKKKPVDTGLKYPTGITLSCDQSLLFVAEGNSHWIYSFQIGPEGSLLNGQRFHCLHVPESADNAASGGLASDSGGRLYVATNMGVQICDQTGRVYFILPMPTGQPSHLCFGGENFDTLVVTCGDAVYRRKLKVKGAPTFGDPVKPPPPRL